MKYKIHLSLMSSKIVLEEKSRFVRKMIRYDKRRTTSENMSELP